MLTEFSPTLEEVVVYGTFERNCRIHLFTSISGEEARWHEDGWVYRYFFRTKIKAYAWLLGRVTDRIDEHNQTVAHNLALQKQCVELLELENTATM